MAHNDDKSTPRPWQIKSDYEPLTIIGDIDGPDEGRQKISAALSRLQENTE